MAYRIEFLPSARREFLSLSKDVQRRIGQRLDTLKEHPRPPGVKVLKGRKGLLRLRIGDYRVIYQIEARRLVVLVVKVAHRREVYR